MNSKVGRCGGEGWGGGSRKIAKPLNGLRANPQVAMKIMKVRENKGPGSASAAD